MPTHEPLPTTPDRVLFVCTGNYYRSRFAEELFNALAERLGLGLSAGSRGLDAADARRRLPGPIATVALDGLRALGVRPRAARRPPRDLRREDLVHAHVVVALRESEHRGPLEARHPDLAHKVVYWDVPDVDVQAAGPALAHLEERVRGLVDRLVVALAG